MIVFPVLMAAVIWQLKRVSGGTIEAFNLESQWQNAVYMQKIRLTFVLENSIQANDYLRFSSPMELGNLNATILTPQLFVLSPTKVFFDYYFTGFAFQSNVIYQVELSISLIPTSAGVKGVFKLYTTSAASNNAFIYDSNEMFGVFVVGPIPKSTLNISAVTTANSSFDATKNNPNSIYDLNVDFTTNISVSPFSFGNASSRFIGNFSNSQFQAQNCRFVNFTCTNTSTCNNITAPVNSSCAVNNFGFIATVDSEILANQSLRLFIEIQNPSKVSSTNLVMTHAARNTFIMYEISNSVTLATVNPISVNVSQIKFLWGLTSGKACPLGIYQPIAISSSAIPVINNFIVNFSPSLNVQGNEFGVIVLFGPKFRIGAIIEGSIYWTGFISVPNGNVVCTSNYPQIGLDQGVVCRGIGLLNASITYSVGARLYGTVYTFSSSANDKTDALNYPKVTFYTVDFAGSTALSSVGTGTGYNFYVNYNLIATQQLNLFTYQDQDGTPIFGRNWALSYVASSNSTTPVVTAQLSDILAVLCLVSSSGTISVYLNENVQNCSIIYKYGVFKDSSVQTNRLILFVNPAEFSATNTWDSSLYPTSELLANTHVIHNFILHKDFIVPNIQKFGLNVIGGLFTNSPSQSSGVDSCGKTISNTRYCYPTQDTSDLNLVNGVFTLNDGVNNLYLYNKYNDGLGDHILITISCVIKTNSDGGCVFQSSTRKLQTVQFPGFELSGTNATMSAVSISSLYPDEKVRDMIYCNYLVPFANIGVNGTTLGSLSEATAINGIKLKMQGLLNWYHLDVPTSISSLSYFLNNICVSNSANSNALSSNDNNHIPLLFRIQYNLLTSAVFDAAAVFFSTKGNLASTPAVQTNGVFGISSGRINAMDFLPHLIAPSFYSLNVSNVVGSNKKVSVNGYAVTGDAPIQPAGDHFWNNHPYFLIFDNSISNDLYVQISHPTFITDLNTCNNFYQISKLVLGLLQYKSGSNSFFNVVNSYVLIATMRYSSSGYYSTKNSINFANLLSRITGFSGSGFSFSSSSLFNPNACLPSNPRTPFTTDYTIGTTTRLSLTTATNSNAGCNLVSNFNGRKFGSAITFTSLSQFAIFKSVVSTTSEFNLVNCAYMNIPSKNVFKGNSLNLQAVICPMEPGVLDLSLSQGLITVDLINPVPWFWALNTKASPTSVLKEILTVGWSMDGQMRFAVGQNYASNNPSNALGSSASCITDPISTLMTSTPTQKLSWSIRSLLADIILPIPIFSSGVLVADSNQGLQIQDSILQSAFNQMALETYGCDTSPFLFTCSLSVDSANAIFTYELLPTQVLTVSRDVNTLIKLYLFASYANSITIPNLKHTTKVYFLKGKTGVNSGNSEMLIMDCGTTGSDFIFNPSARSNLMTINSIRYSQMPNLYSPFSIFFTYPSNIGFWQAPVNSAVQITTFLALGSLWNSVAQQDNMKCSVLQNNIFSHDFATITTSPGNFTLVSKGTKDFLTTYEFRCYGGLSPSSVTTNVSIVVSSSKGILATGSSKIPLIAQSNPVQNATPALTVNFTSPTFNSAWNFTLQFSSPIQFGTNFIYLRFPTSFLPWISASGSLDCVLDNKMIYNRTVLSGVSDLYTLEVIPDKNYNARTTFNLIIYGIVMPTVYSSYSQIEIHLDNNTNVFDGVLEKQLVNAVNLTSIGINTSILHLLFYNRSTNFIRKSSNHLFAVGLTPSQIFKSSFLFINFDHTYHSSFSQPINFTTCTVLQQFNPNATNIASTCNQIGHSFVKVAISSNFTAFSSPQTFLITIGPIENPEYETESFQIPQIFLTDALSSQILGFTTSMYINATTEDFIAPQNLLNVQFVDLQGNALESSTVFRGYFGTRIKLSYPINTTSTGLKIQLMNDSTAGLIIFQPLYQNLQKLTILSSETSAEFTIAALANFGAGEAKLHFQVLLNDIRILDLPKLELSVKTVKYLISPSIASLNLAAATDAPTYSFPLVFNFTNCMPVTNITLNVTLDPNTNAEGLFSIDQSSQTLVNSFGPKNLLLIYFVSAKAGTSPSKSFNINFTVDSYNQAYYSFTQSFITMQTLIYVNAVIAPSSPLITTNPGTVTIQFNCNEAATIFYTFGIGITIIQQGSIEASTISQGIQTTVVDKTTASLSKLGWTIQQSQSSFGFAISAGDLKTNANYTLFMYCKNLQNIVSNVVTASWTQADSGAQVGRIDAIFSQQPNITEKINILNFLCTTIQARIGALTDLNGNTCNNLATSRLLQTNTSTNTTSTSTNTTSTSTNTTSTSTNTTLGIPFTYTVYFHPNIFLSYSETSVKFSPLANVNLTLAASITPYQIGALKLSYFALPSIRPVIDTTISRIDTTLTSFNSTLLNIRAALGFYFFAGISSVNSKTPTSVRLLAGQDGDGNQLLSPMMYQYFTGSTIHQITFGGLSPNTEYTLYLMISSENIGSMETLYSPVYSFPFATKITGFSAFLSTFIWFNLIMFLLIQF